MDVDCFVCKIFDSNWKLKEKLNPLKSKRPHMLNLQPEKYDISLIWNPVLPDCCSQITYDWIPVLNSSVKESLGLIGFLVSGEEISDSLPSPEWEVMRAALAPDSREVGTHSGSQVNTRCAGTTPATIGSTHLSSSLRKRRVGRSGWSSCSFIPRTWRFNPASAKISRFFLLFFLNLTAQKICRICSTFWKNN